MNGQNQSFITFFFKENSLNDLKKKKFIHMSDKFKQYNSISFAIYLRKNHNLIKH